MSTVVAVLVALAVLAGGGLPGRRGVVRGGRVRRVVRSGTWLGGADDAVGRASGGAGGERLLRRGADPARGARVPLRRGARPRGGRGRRGPAAEGGGLRVARRRDLAGVLHAVAAQLRAGAPPADAWAAVLGRPVDGGVPTADALLAAVGPPPRRWGRTRTAEHALRARTRAVVAGAGVAVETGAPLADVLTDLAAAVAADAEQAADLAAALAGPRATARVLVLLPALGLGVGAALGARPWEVLTGGGVGAAVGVAGCALAVGGHAWVAALLRRAAT